MTKTCSKCGRTSRKFSAECWVKGNMCSVCYIKEGRRKYPRKTTMVCKRCGIEQDRATGLCWREEGMCGRCHQQELHPKKVNRYKICPECNNVMVMLMYFKNRTTHKTNLYKCVKCQVIHDLGVSEPIIRHTQSIGPIEVLPNQIQIPQR